MSLSPFIDHTLLKQTATRADIQRLCAEAREYGFAAVCVPPYYVKDAAALLAKTPVKVATVIGFPFGYTYAEAKAAEAERAVKEGAHELDVVANVAALKSGDDTYLEKEIAALAGVTEKSGTTVKVIIESGVLTDEEIIGCCRLYQKFPVHFLKTSTGYAEKGATVEAVQLLRQHLPSRIQIKASGGIKTYAFARQLIEAGATRLGTSSGVAIVTGEGDGSAGY